MIDKIEADLKTALRAGDKDKVLVLKGLKSSLINKRIELGRELSEDDAMKVLQKEAKQRTEAADIYKRGGAEDKAAKELQEKDVIEEYLPQAMSEEEIAALADEVIAKTGKDPKQTGTIIGQVMQKSQGRADGKTVADIVNNKLK